MTSLLKVPREHARIAWSYGGPNGGIVQVSVFDDRQPLDDHYECDTGSGDVGTWLKGNPACTPEGAYITLETLGFKDQKVRLQALEGFARIEGCEWAVTMAATVRADLAAQADSAGGDEDE